MAGSVVAQLHYRARDLEYSGGVKRFPVPDDKVPWAVSWPEYAPVDYTSAYVLRGPVWADPDIRSVTSHKLRFNTVDGNINRRSFMGEYAIVQGVPRNPIGRTGMVGRGILGKWGPNHAADPIVTRWKRGPEGDKVLHPDGKPLLDFVSIKRKDTGEWAIPGGMVDAGESVSATLKREFGEEALNSLEATAEEKAKMEKTLGELFSSGTEIYTGYVDDPRNTDNAWMETVAVNFHDETGKIFDKITLSPGDDAGQVMWTGATSDNKMYSNHSHFVEKTAALHGAHW